MNKHFSDIIDRRENLTEVDRINALLQDITLEQYAFNKWMDELEKSGDGFKIGLRTPALSSKPVKLSWWKCWFLVDSSRILLGSR